MQYLASVHQHGLQKKRAEKPEVGIADHRQPQRTVGKHEAYLLPEFSHKVEAKLSLRRRRGNFGDAQAAQQPDSGQSEQNHSGVRFALSKNMVQPTRRHRAGDDRQKCSQLDYAVAPGQPFFRQQLRKQSILRRSEDRRLNRNNEQDQKGQRKMLEQQRRMLPKINGALQILLLMRRESEDGHHHHHDLDQLGSDRDPALAEAVGKISAGHAENDQSHEEQAGNQRDQGVALVLVEPNSR